VVETAEPGSRPEAPLPPDAEPDPITAFFNFSYDPGPDPENPETIWISTCPVWANSPEGELGAAVPMPEVHYFELRNIQGRVGSPMFVPGYQSMGAGDIHLTIRAQVIPRG